MAERGEIVSPTARYAAFDATPVPDEGYRTPRNMSSHDSTTQLEEAFANLHRGQDPDGSFLDEAVRSYTDEMKAVGWTAEQVIVGVKRAANRSGAMMRKTPRSIMEPSSAAQMIVSQAVTLSIDHYFGDDGNRKS